MSVLIWRVQPEDEAALDRYEGWPHLYRKEALRLTVNKERGRAMVYIMNADRRPYGVPSAVYFNTIREGYTSANFDTGILYDAVKHSKAVAK